MNYIYGMIKRRHKTSEDVSEGESLKTKTTLSTCSLKLVVDKQAELESKNLCVGKGQVIDSLLCELYRIKKGLL